MTQEKDSSKLDRLQGVLLLEIPQNLILFCPRC